MEIRDNVYVEEMVGTNQQIKYKITEQSMRIIMHALINMYSNPVGSIVREVTANALDAVKERNLKADGKRQLEKHDAPNYWSTDNNVYLTITEPNPLWGDTPAFIIKDFGNGLSEERIFNVFTTFGESTKRVDNQEIGGLNSKPSLNWMNCWKATA